MRDRSHRGSTALLLAAFGLLLVGCQSSGRGRAAAPPAPYLRVANHDNGVVALEVAIRSLTPARRNAPMVWLVGVTHLGSAEYYRALQEFLDQQTVVLFEGVGATNRDFQLAPGEYSLQDAMARALGLEFQLNAVQYDRPHFRNSDLTAAQISRHFGGGLEEDAGDGEGRPPANEFGALVQVMQGTGFLGGLAKLTVSLISVSPRLQAATKLALIETMGAMPADLAATPGLNPAMQRLLKVLIEERNRAVIADTRRALREKTPSEIGGDLLRRGPHARPRSPPSRGAAPSPWRGTVADRLRGGPSPFGHFEDGTRLHSAAGSPAGPRRFSGRRRRDQPTGSYFAATSRQKRRE
ncbi:MAG: hypothetical protein IPM17_14855 [Verrucomicrobia bacterium]|nr:hypothetical protein [Verrucomicrobiota bacterium]